MVPCIQCEAEPSQLTDCSAAWGVCGHSYHFHCITKWLRTRSTCPLDGMEIYNQQLIYNIAILHTQHNVT